MKGDPKMPQIDVTLPAGALKAEAQSQLLERLTKTLLKWEGVPENSPSVAFAWAYLHEVSYGQWAFGSKVADNTQLPRYRVAIIVPEGVLDAEHKRGLVEEVTSTIVEIEGKEEGEGSSQLTGASRITCYILEVPEGGYGVAGRVYQRQKQTPLVLWSSLS
jgi:phenylpyruvate tautomerase PptA (4-oxalocrotonate tautomerase family)